MALHYATLHSTTLISLHYSQLHNAALHCTTLHYSTLLYTNNNNYYYYFYYYYYHYDYYYYYITLHYANYITLRHYVTPHYITVTTTTATTTTTLLYTTLHYPTLHTLHCTAFITPPQTQLQLHYTNYTTSQLQLHHTTTTTTATAALHHTTSSSCGWGDDRVTTATIVTFPKNTFSPAVDSLCHPWFTTTKLSYRFPVFETSATALRGTTGNYMFVGNTWKYHGPAGPFETNYWLW